MKIEPNDLMLFAQVVEAGSFSGAAIRLHVPKSTISRRLAALENSLGERLLLRTTRKLTVTELGRSILDHGQQVSAEVDAAVALAHHRQTEPRGRLRISMPGDFATVIMVDKLSRFMDLYPSISLELDLSPRRVDLIAENFDVVIRMGDLPDDASLAARQVARFKSRLFASPNYLARHGIPQVPDELPAHSGLYLMQRTGETLAWVLRNAESEWQGRPTARAVINSPELLVRLACAGKGIAAVPEEYATPFLQAGELVPVLPQWSLPPATAWAVFPGRRLMPARTRAFLDFLITEFRGHIA